MKITVPQERPRELVIKLYSPKKKGIKNYNK